MTVMELIRELSNYPPDCEVKIKFYFCSGELTLTDYSRIESVEVEYKNNKVIISGS